jgi:hypothetical protein
MDVLSQELKDATGITIGHRTHSLTIAQLPSDRVLSVSSKMTAAPKRHLVLPDTWAAIRVV